MEKTIKKLLLLFILWRAGLFLIGAVSDQIVAYSPEFPYSNEILNSYDLPRWLYSWANFDGVHYLTIIEKGYIGTGLIQAFFPLFPYLGKMIAFVTQNALISALIVSNISMIGLLIVWYLFFRSEYSKSDALYAVALLLLFPTSLFFAATYTESLFLLLVISTLWSAKKKKWWLAGLLGAFTTATRVTGLAIIPALIVEWWLQEHYHHKKPWKKTDFGPLIASLFPLVGAGIYMIFLWGEFSDPLYFWSVQADFGGVRDSGIVLYPQTLWRSIKVIITAEPNLRLFSYIQETFWGVAGAALLLFGTKKIRPSYLTFGWLAFLLPTLTGTFSSLPRYAMVSFPILLSIYFVTKDKSWKRYLVLTIFSILLIINTVLFIQGRWVA